MNNINLIAQHLIEQLNQHGYKTRTDTPLNTETNTTRILINSYPTQRPLSTTAIIRINPTKIEVSNQDNGPPYNSGNNFYDTVLDLANPHSLEHTIQSILKHTPLNP